MSIQILLPGRHLRPLADKHKVQPIGCGHFVIQPAITQKQRGAFDITGREFARHDIAFDVGAAEDATVKIIRNATLIENGSRLGLVAARYHQPAGMRCLLAELLKPLRNSAGPQALMDGSGIG